MLPQSTNWMPSLNVPRTARTNSTSSMRRDSLKARRCGTVASPTPTMPMSSDSTSTIAQPLSFSVCARPAAAIQPAVPPPTMTMLFSRSSVIEPIVAPFAATNSKAFRSELHAQGHAHGPRHASDVAGWRVSGALDDSIGSGGIDVINQIVLVRDVERVDSYVHRSQVAQFKVLRDLQVERLIARAAVHVEPERITRCAGREGGGSRQTGDH